MAHKDEMDLPRRAAVGTLNCEGSNEGGGFHFSRNTSTSSHHVGKLSRMEWLIGTVDLAG